MKRISIKSIPGYSRYLIYSDGRVYDSEKQKFCKQYDTASGYLYISVHVNGKRKNLKVHRLVALAFLPNPDNKPEVDHKDTDKTNNIVVINDDGSVNEALSNLRWVTKKENARNPLTKQHYFDNHADFSGESNPNYGKQHTEEWKQDMSERFSGERNPMYGTHRTEEQKQIQSKKMKGKPQNKKHYRNKITGHITDASWLTKWINQGKTTKDQWELVEQ